MLEPTRGEGPPLPDSSDHWLPFHAHIAWE